VDILGARLAGAAFNGGKQGGGFAADERARSLGDLNIKGEIRAQNIFSQKAHFPCVRNRLGQMRYGERIFVPDVDVALVRADRVSADDHAFDHTVGIAFHEAAVHVGAGIAFIAVGDDILGIAMRPAHAFPLDGRVKSSAAAAPEAGFFHFADNGFGRHFGKHFTQRLIAVDGKIIFNARRIDHAVLAENHPVLLFVKGQVFLAEKCFLGFRMAVQQAADHFAFGDGFGDDFRNVFDFHVLIKIFVGMDDHHGAFFAESQASGGQHVHVA